MKKQPVDVVRNVNVHWVGNGLPVRTLFSYQSDPARISPFLMLDYAAPVAFRPSEEPRGVGAHPHRGFETVTIVYQGALEHRDSAGHQGTVGPGDVQWMTAASGVVHEEWHERDFAKQGGVLEMAQLWVNLPSQDKMGPPRYQEIRSQQIPEFSIGNSARARLIAGELNGHKGPAQSFTPITLLDLQIPGGEDLELPIPDGETAILLVRSGQVQLGEGESLEGTELAIFGREGDRLAIKAEQDASLLVLAGTPINEPVVGQGPFVMNSTEEIRQAFLDYREGRMG